MAQVNDNDNPPVFLHPLPGDTLRTLFRQACEEVKKGAWMVRFKFGGVDSMVSEAPSDTEFEDAFLDFQRGHVSAQARRVGRSEWNP